MIHRLIKPGFMTKSANNSELQPIVPPIDPCTLTIDLHQYTLNMSRCGVVRLALNIPIKQSSEPD